MTFVGKLVVVLILILSLCFMAFAGAVYTVQENWKKTAEGLQLTVKENEAEWNALDEAYKQFKDEMDAKVDNEETRADAAENNVRLLEAKNAVLTTQLETTRTERDTQRQLAIIAGEEATERRNEAVAQRLVNENLHRALNDLITRARALEDTNFSISIEKKSMLVKHTRILDQVKALQRLARANGFDADPKELAKQQAPPPLVVGRVLATKKGARNAAEFVEISVGSDDGLIKGHTMAVFRTGRRVGQRAKYLGDIQIVHVTPDRAVGTVVLRAKNGVIERGDNVTTKL